MFGFGVKGLQCAVRFAVVGLWVCFRVQLYFILAGLGHRVWGFGWVSVGLSLGVSKGSVL